MELTTSSIACYMALTNKLINARLRPGSVVEAPYADGWVS